MDEKKKQIRNIALAAAGIVVLYWGLNHLELLKTGAGKVIGILSPFLVGLCIAYVLSVPMRGFEKLLFRPNKKTGKVRFEKFKAPVSLTLSILAVLLAVTAVVALVVPELGRTAIAIRDGIPDFVTRMQDWGSKVMNKHPQILTAIEKVDWAGIWNSALTFLKSGVGSFAGSTVSAISSVFNGATTFCLGCIFACYVLLQRHTLARQCKKLLYAHLKEERVDRFLEVCTLTDRTFSKFITGQCVEAVILGSMFFVSMLLFRFPYALMISVLIAFLALVPIFGAIVGCVVGALLILVNDPVQALWFLVLFQVLQQIEGNFIYPKVVGSSVGLPGIWVLVAVTIGGSAMGILGMLVMVPAGSVIYTLLRSGTAARLKKRDTPAEKYR